MTFSFKLDATDGLARAGQFTTPHGVMNTPQFMPVGTLASVKSLDPEDLERLGAIAVPRADYHKVMEPLLERNADFFTFQQDDDPETVLAWASPHQSSG